MKKPVTTALTAAVALAATGAAQAQEVFLRCVYDKDPEREVPDKIYAFSDSRQLIWEYNPNSGQLMSMCGDAFLERWARIQNNISWRYTTAICRVRSNYIEDIVTQVSTPSNTNYSSAYTNHFSAVHIVRGTGRFAWLIDPEDASSYGEDGQCTRIADPRSSAPAF